MAAIEGIEGLSAEALDYQISLGGRFVVYSYAISVLVMSFRRSSNVPFVRSDENAALRGLPYTLLAALLGWWGIPWATRQHPAIRGASPRLAARSRPAQ